MPHVIEGQIEGQTRTQATRDNPVPTEVDGVVCTGDGMYEANAYAVTFTLYLDAASAEEAESRAMQFRNAIGMDGRVLDADWYWHLHDHDGC